jgi:hypothetical protein
MPKRVLILFGAIALSLAACGGSGSSSATPTSGPIISPTPNQSIRSGSVYVTLAGLPQYHVPVLISTPQSSANPRPGTPFASETTEPAPKKSPGFATFKHLKPGATYCWVATIKYHSPTPYPSATPTATASPTSIDRAPTPTPSPVVASNCANNWQFDIVPLGN